MITHHLVALKSIAEIWKELRESLKIVTGAQIKLNLHESERTISVASLPNELMLDDDDDGRNLLSNVHASKLFYECV